MRATRLIPSPKMTSSCSLPNCVSYSFLCKRWQHYANRITFQESRISTLSDLLRIAPPASSDSFRRKSTVRIRLVLVAGFYGKISVHLVDIWNIIESFRENGLNAVESTTEVKVSRIELLLSTVYHNLNKRLPVAQQIDTDKSIGLLLSFLLGAYDRCVVVIDCSKKMFQSLSVQG